MTQTELDALCAEARERFATVVADEFDGNTAKMLNSRGGMTLCAIYADAQDEAAERGLTMPPLADGVTITQFHDEVTIKYEPSKM